MFDFAQRLVGGLNKMLLFKHKEVFLLKNHHQGMYVSKVLVMHKLEQNGK